MELNHAQLENLKTLLDEWEVTREKLELLASLAFGLCMTGLGEELNWSVKKINAFVPVGLIEKQK